MFQIIVDSATVVLALVALVYTAVSVGLQKKHNFKSLLPLPWLALGDYTHHIKVKLQNHGPGPLLIKKFRAYVGDGAETKTNLIDLMPKGTGIVWSNFIAELNHRWLKADGELPLLEWTGESEEVRLKIRSALATISVEIEYEDVYGNSFPVFARKLDWFARQS